VPGFPLDRFRVSLADMADAIGLDAETMLQAWTDETADGRMTGTYGSVEGELETICRSRGVCPSPSGLREAIQRRHDFSRSLLGPRPDAVSTLKALREDGRRLALVSNCSFEVPELWPETAFDGLFDVTIFSCSVGVKKPDPAIYRLACDGLGVAPEACVYVGDGFGDELKAARAFGMKPYLLLPPDEPLPDSDHWEGHHWDGDRIASLGQVLDVVRAPQTG